MKRILTLIFIVVIGLSTKGQNDTIESNQVRQVVKDNDFSNRLFYKTSDSIPFTGFLVEYYPNSKKINWIVEYKDGKLKTGLYTFYYENSNKKTEQYVNDIGQRFGTYKDWFSNGQLKSTGEYLNDEKNGTWKTWDIDGNLLSTEVYENGIFKEKK